MNNTFFRVLSNNILYSVGFKMVILLILEHTVIQNASNKIDSSYSKLTYRSFQDIAIDSCRANLRIYIHNIK